MLHIINLQKSVRFDGQIVEAVELIIKGGEETQNGGEVNKKQAVIQQK